MQKIVVGIDEAGRGPLAGPVIACALTVQQNPKSKFQIPKLRDSKLLSARQREVIYTELKQNLHVLWGVGSMSEKTIDKINIYQATRLAMKKAVLSLEYKLRKRAGEQPVHATGDRNLHVPMAMIDSLIIDGNTLLDLPMRQKAVVRADATVLQCMAASIVAKVTRDRLMQKLHKKYPLYGFDRHKGYGTAYHLKMLRRFGPCEIHRQTYRPVTANTKAQNPNAKTFWHLDFEI